MGFLKSLGNKKGFELWHLGLVAIVVAALMYFLLPLGTGTGPVDADGCTTGDIGICCYEKTASNDWKQVDCTAYSSALQTQAVFESPVGTVLLSGVQGVSFKYRITNTGNTDINANVQSVACDTNPGGVDAAACSGPAGVANGGGAFAAKMIAQGAATQEWQTNVVDLQSGLPAGTYDLTVTISAQDTAGLLSPVVQQGTMQFKNTPESVSFTVQVVNA